MGLIAKLRKHRGSGDRPPVPFVVGVTRSGTTLLRLMLDAHPELAIPPETHFVPQLIKAAKKRGASADDVANVVIEHRQFGDFGLDDEVLRARFHDLSKVDPSSAVRTFFELYAEREGKQRWGDKTPNYIKRMRQIQRWVPEARFVHMIRDGRDAALSRRKRLLKEPPPMDLVAHRWQRKIEKARTDSNDLSHYMELRYEDLLTDTEGSLRRVCEFLDLAFDPVMLTYHESAEQRMAEMHRDLPEEPGKPLRPADHRKEAHLLTSKPPDPTRIAQWKQNMDAADIAAFEATAGGLLAELGYDLVGPGQEADE